MIWLFLPFHKLAELNYFLAYESTLVVISSVSWASMKQWCLGVIIGGCWSQLKYFRILE